MPRIRVAMTERWMEEITKEKTSTVNDHILSASEFELEP